MIDQIELWFKRAVPNPTDKNKDVQLGCHLEEVAEMLMTLSWSSNDPSMTTHAQRVTKGLEQLATALKSGNVSATVNNKVEFQDALSDQIVTSTGLSHMHRLPAAAALAEVNSSNWSKFDENGNPIFDANGKISKGPNYKKADLVTVIASHDPEVLKAQAVTKVATALAAVPTLTTKASSLDVQVGGNHYKRVRIQPVEYIAANNLGFLEGCVVKRITRWRDKPAGDQFEDLRKIKHEVDLLIEMESKWGPATK